MHHLPKVSFAAVFVAALSISLASAQSSSNSSMAKALDAKFMKEAAQGGMAEVALGQLATEKASSREVKKFGQRMVDDHSKANDDLKRLAAQKNVDLPQDLSAKDKATKATLEKLSGENFDQAYMKDMVKDHKKDVSDFQRASQSAHDPDVKSFASQTLPTLQDHLREAESVTAQNTAAR